MDILIKKMNKSSWQKIGKKFIEMVIAIFVLMSLTFFLMKSIPGDPFEEEQALPQEIQDSLKRHYGLDQPLYKQYTQYLLAIMRGDLGPSFRYKDRTVNDVIRQGFPTSALLGFEALVLAVSTGLLLGTWAAFRENQWQDRLAMFMITMAIAVPSFVLATVLQYVLTLKIPLFPPARWGTLSHAVLPAISLAALPAAFIARLIRSNMLEVLQSDYIKTAKAKGLSSRTILWKHVLRNAFLPVLTYLGPLTANILVGSFVVEKIFNIPGLGQWLINSVGNRDYTMIMGLTLFYSFILMGTILIVDVIYRLLDPRIKV